MTIENNIKAKRYNFPLRLSNSSQDARLSVVIESRLEILAKSKNVHIESAATAKLCIFHFSEYQRW